MRLRFLPVFLTVLSAIPVFAAGCSDDDGQEMADGDRPAVASDFCSEAERFINDRSLTDPAGFNAEFFVEVDAKVATLIETAPPPIREDLETLRSGFAASDEIFADFDYDVADQELGAALAELDNTSILRATDDVQQFLQDNCELAPVGSLDPHRVSDIMDVFGVDRERAECLNLELGDVANIGTDELTPELLGRRVCGTSLAVLLASGEPTT